MDQDEAKRLAAERALELLPESGVIGLGSGSTARYFIEGVGRRVAGGQRLVGVPSSETSRELGARAGIPMLDDEGPWDIDLCVDGADEVSSELDVIKGGGGAHTREKIVNDCARLNVIIVDHTKLSQRLGERRPVPVEVLRFAHRSSAERLRRYGKVELRTLNGGPFLTDSGQLLYDVFTGPISNPAALESELREIVGVVEVGLFCGRADRVIVAGPSGIEELRPG